VVYNQGHNDGKAQQRFALGPSSQGGLKRGEEEETELNKKETDIQINHTIQ
jgi:hypothetical protein